VTLTVQDGLSVLEITQGAHAELPDLSEAWAWAHTQVASGGATDVGQALAGGGSGAISR